MYYCSHITFIVRSVMRPASITRKRRWGREIPIQPDRHRDWKFGVQLLTRLFRSLNDTQYSLIENPSRLAYLLTGDIKPSITRIEKMSLCGCLPTWHTQILRVYSVPTSYVVWNYPIGVTGTSTVVAIAITPCLALASPLLDTALIVPTASIQISPRQVSSSASAPACYPPESILPSRDGL